jgi:hypothetical protein
MKRFRALPLISLAALLLAGPAPASEHNGQDERPRIDQYSDASAFIEDLLAWQRRQQTRQQDDTGHQSAPESDHDWHHVTGPENLEEALRNAYGYQQPDYKEQYRFNRTTHLSFPLESLPSNQLSSQAIQGGLRETAGEHLSLQPLPELQTILEETSDLQSLSLGDDPSSLPDGQTPAINQGSEIQLR